MKTLISAGGSDEALFALASASLLSLSKEDCNVGRTDGSLVCASGTDDALACVSGDNDALA